VSADAANMNCSRRRRRGSFFSSRMVRRGRNTSRASATIAALFMVESDEIRRKNMVKITCDLENRHLLSDYAPGNPR
jgi:hypothetical protein